MSNFKRLCEITAEMINAEKVSNPALKRLFRQMIHRQGDSYVFSSSKRKNHKDEKHHSDGIQTMPYSSETYHDDENVHTDHEDHYDHTESEHSENGYSELEYHTDSTGHRDHTESEHRDTADD